jgi:hypothetical protein
VEQKAKSLLFVTVALASLGLAGFVGVSYAVSKDEAPAAHYPNDRANHHPLHAAS